MDTITYGIRSNKRQSINKKLDNVGQCWTMSNIVQHCPTFDYPTFLSELVRINSYIYAIVNLLLFLNGHDYIWHSVQQASEHKQKVGQCPTLSNIVRHLITYFFPTFSLLFPYFFPTFRQNMTCQNMACQNMACQNGKAMDLIRHPGEPNSWALALVADRTQVQFVINLHTHIASGLTEKQMVELKNEMREYKQATDMTKKPDMKT
jgi:hypothetical protein